ncbi:phosphate/phosphite/phosphonate ABC transporter substrate-binding protein [Sneathiella sp.]|uniref:phosphate/phosphite/phosphonate ABC transporter substrate-binding protein n=1 Tax=Sneathiella sp. TaxID=1964365 RepID=UPI003569DDED
MKTGSHRKSIQAVADGTVDVAAIDAVSWELAKRHEPAAATLRVIKTTNPTPGLPYISARRSARDVDQIHLAVIDAMASLEESIREDLLLMGFAATQDTDYQIIKNRYEIITAAPTITI